MYKQSPYKNIPEDLLESYTMNNKIPILSKWRDDSKSNKLNWSDEMIKTYRERFSIENVEKGNILLPKTKLTKDIIEMVNNCKNLLFSFKKYDIRNKKVAVVGSITPWIESMLLNLDNKVTTIEYNVPKCNLVNLNCEDYFDYFEKNENEYDAIVTFSSIEHSGLGRYGDPLDPDGDLKTMDVIHKNLKKNGILIWGAPLGADALVWNCHRIYGKIRLPILFKKFTEIEWLRWEKEEIFKHKVSKDASKQPVIILKKND